MLHERKHDADFVRAIETVRKQLAAAKARVANVYPGAHLRWVVESSVWVVVDRQTRETIESSKNLDDLGTGQASVRGKPQSGTHRRMGQDDS